jgi:hypothetical protein
VRPSLFVYDLAALGSLLASLVFFTGLVYSGKFFGAARPARWPPIIKWMWRFAWMLWLVAVITFVVLRIQYPVDGDITITPHAPPEEHVLQLLALGGVIGGYILLWAWWLALAFRGARARLRGRERNATAMPQPLSQRLGHVAVVILTLIIVVIAGATCPFVTLAILYLIGLAMPR